MPVAFVLPVALSACAGNADLDRLAADKTLVTGTVGNQNPVPDDTRASDEAAIRATVSAWAPGEIPPELMPWVNARTGSSGAISRVSDLARPGEMCRSFTASRESFDGVGLYRGNACTSIGGAWVVEQLDPA